MFARQIVPPKLSRRRLLVVSTIATACCTGSTRMQLKFCSQFFTRPHDWLCGNGSSTALHRQSEMTFTSLAFSAAEKRLKALHDHLQVLASDCSGVPSRLVRASLNHCQSPSPAFSCSWWLTSPGNQNCYFWAPQLRFECPQTLEQSTTSTPRLDTDS